MQANYEDLMNQEGEKTNEEIILHPTVLPPRRQFFRVQAGRVSVPTPHRAGVRPFGDDEARRGPLRVVADHPC